jgi:hypothetical protein
VFYRLLEPALAAWLTAGLSFIDPEPESHRQHHVAVEQVGGTWNTAPPLPALSDTVASPHVPESPGRDSAIAFGEVT